MVSRWPGREIAVSQARQLLSDTAGAENWFRCGRVR
jgi:hypothetical protein